MHKEGRETVRTWVKMKPFSEWPESHRCGRKPPANPVVWAEIECSANTKVMCLEDATCRLDKFLVFSIRDAKGCRRPAVSQTPGIEAVICAHIAEID
jgi:hypothetical protein